MEIEAFTTYLLVKHYIVFTTSEFTAVSPDELPALFDGEKLIAFLAKTMFPGIEFA